MKRWMCALLLLSANSLAAAPNGPPAAGRAILLHGNNNGALPCAACHGVNGQGNAAMGAPRLAGLPAASIETALANFADGNGGNATMQYIAQSLSPAQTQAVAAYLSSLK